ncbi:type I-E CRISPR-associated protein Cse1/CasA [Amycolatopsis cihanbeyliensis]|uniref:type I-E CRISPR-associated protein Cse1/CasA n=1 Tax=Amycolatopsis cihanbeyliensis TaxID=1128664 RepID=UPI001154C980|nr:type I-E CRISPR-associated protein Cse1/CasA [Amycolatopsis cihanbeyliensis]
MNADDRHTFSLIDQPWLPARTTEGTAVELSLVEVFERAHRLANLSSDLPTQYFALIRTLLAVLHGALEGPRNLKDWEQLWGAEHLPHEVVAAYLERHRERFDLLHPYTPFFQVADLSTTKGETSELSKLIADVPNGRPFFTNRLDRRMSLSFAEAARWLVHCQAFDPSGIKSGAIGDDRVKKGKGYPIGTGWSGRLGGLLPEGRSLRETLLLNLIPRDFALTKRAHESDLPVWEHEQLGATVRPDPVVRGPIDLYTWQSRRIRLVPENGKVTRVLICNGDPVEPQNRHRDEPHTRWRRSAAQEKKSSESVVYMPREHDPERAIWRGLESILPGTAGTQRKEAAAGLTAGILEWLSLLSDDILDGDFPVQIRAIGMAYGNQNSVTDEIMDDALSLRSALLRQDATQLTGMAVGCVQAADDAARALGSLALNLAQAAGKAPPKPGAPDPASLADRTRAVELAYAELDAPFRGWLSGLGPDSDPVEEQVAWHRTACGVVRALARDLQQRAPATAWTGRRVNGYLVTAAHAALWFDRKLREALPQAFPDRAGQGASA